MVFAVDPSTMDTIGFCEACMPMGSSMLDDRSSTITMSSPCDFTSDSANGNTGSMRPRPASTSAAASATKGSRRSREARLARSTQPTVVDAA